MSSTPDDKRVSATGLHGIVVNGIQPSLLSWHINIPQLWNKT
jgi:hypothetical protein